MSDRTALIVLGMHRSGTSSVAGAMTLLGGAPPRTLMPAADDNPRGFWESLVLMEFHDRLLEAGGSNWRDWRPFNLSAVLEARPEFRDEARRLLDSEFGNASLIVLKDPRICRFFPLWDGVLDEAGYRTVILSPLRAPAEVAASLTVRNDMGQAEALRLWLRHVLDAERASRGLPRLFLDWNDFLSNWRAAASLANQTLGLALAVEDAARSAAVDDFLSGDLRRHIASRSEIAPWASDVHDVLAGFATDGEGPGARDRLDEIRWMFDAASNLFADAPR